MFNWEMIKKQAYIFGITTILILLLKNIVSTFLIQYVKVDLIAQFLSIFLIVAISSLISRKYFLGTF